jgi:hypothetical protein
VESADPKTDIPTDREESNSMTTINRVNQVRLAAEPADVFQQDDDMLQENYTGDIWIAAGAAFLSAMCFMISHHGGGMSFFLIGIYGAAAAAWPLWDRLTGKYI